jgi:branched-chain amino acid transport system substrate-binding protein
MSKVIGNSLSVFVLAGFAYAATASDSSAAEKEVVSLAYIGPLTGSSSHIGLGGRNSADLAVRLRNADTRSKYEYKLLSFDDECKPNVGVQIVTRVAADSSISAAIAHYCSSVAMATVGIFHQFEMPMTTFTAIAPEITNVYNYKEVTRVVINAADQLKVSASELVKLGYTTFGIIRDSTAYGASLDKAFVPLLEAAGGKIVANFSVPPEQQDFTAELTKLREANPQIIFVEGLAPLAIRVRLQMDKLGVDSQFAGVSGIWSSDLLKNLGALAEGTISQRLGKPIEELPEGKVFLDKYAEQKYDAAPDAWGHYAYAEANLIMDEVEKVGPSRGRLVDALRAAKDHPTLVGNVTFNDKGQNTNDTADLIVVQDGVWLDFAKSEYAMGVRKLKRTTK